ncbi:MgtC/SapB family protein [candidate division WWE3 bacterium]|nr:MgtC/SapB family protein [candidate division WWE3 bacterium]
MLSGFIGQNEIHLIQDLLLSLVAGFAIGSEREARGKDAGISTHTLVITGAMLFTFLSSVVDPASKSRIAAQIVSGIGFLGAGLILKEGSNVRNLTTAASIWVSGAIGMAFGFNFHAIGLIVTAAVVVIPRIPHINKKSPEAMTEKKL